MKIRLKSTDSHSNCGLTQITILKLRKLTVYILLQKAATHITNTRTHSTHIRRYLYLCLHIYVVKTAFSVF